MNLLYTSFELILSQGVHEGLTAMQQKDVRFINGEALVVFLICFPAVPVCYFMLPDSHYYWTLLCFFCSFLSTIILNRLRLYTYAKMTLIIIAEIATFWASATFGWESNLHYIFIIVVFASMLTFQKKDKRSLFFVLSMTIAMLTMLYVTDSNTFGREPLADAQIQIIQLTSFVLCLLGSIVIALLYIQKFSQQRQIIETYNVALENKIDELQKLNHELDRFVYSVSHDLRSPISSVLGLIHLSKLSDDLDEIRQYLQMQEKSLKKLEHFIGDILSYARNNRVELHVEPIDFRYELEEVLSLQMQHDPEKKITTSISVTQHSEFWTDKQRFAVILNNLVGNAFRYHNPLQHQSFIRIIAEVSDQKAIIHITDNGIGIGKEHIDKIFGMFYRATTTTTGSGLGLYITKEVVEKLGGSIHVSSQLGEGTDFRIELPNLSQTASQPSMAS